MLGNAKKLLCAAAALCAPGIAAASPFDEVRGGVFIQGLGPFGPDQEDGIGINGELLLNPLNGLAAIGAPRPHVGVSVATDEYATSQVYAGLTWEQHFTPRLFINGGLGVAVHDGEVDFNPPDPLLSERSYLGCRALFRLSADLGYMMTDRLSASVHVDHISNAGLCSENEGLDNTGFRLGYRF